MLIAVGPIVVTMKRDTGNCCMANVLICIPSKGPRSSIIFAYFYKMSNSG